MTRHTTTSNRSARACPPRVRILTEAGPDVGLGHLSRCTALGDAFRMAGCTVELTVCADPRDVALAVSPGTSFQRWWGDDEAVLSIARGSDVLVVDSYHLSQRQATMLQGQTPVLIFFDDNVRLHYPPSIILNGAVHAKHLPYSSVEHTLLAGPEFQPLRVAFRPILRRNEHAETIQSIFVMIGGSDLRGILPRVLDATIGFAPRAQVDVVLGLAREPPRHEHIVLHRAPSETHLRGLMQKADIAVTAGGQALYELAASGTPAITVEVAENQRHSLLVWEEIGYTRHAASWDDADLAHRIQLTLAACAPSSVRAIMSQRAFEVMRGNRFPDAVVGAALLQLDGAGHPGLGSSDSV